MFLKEAGYGWPVFRCGRIFNSIDMDFETADSVAERLKKNAVGFSTYISENPKEFGFKKVQPIGHKSECEIERREGPIVLYPRFSVSFNNTQAEARASITVCSPPRLSKLWLRLSYRLNGEGTSNQYQMKEEDVVKFFNKADLVSEKSVNVWASEYSHAVQQKTDKMIRRRYTIKIKTVAANLGVAAQMLESRTFRMTDLFSGNGRFGALQRFLHLVYGEDVSSLEKYEQLSKRYEWFAMSMYGENSTVGLYSRYHGDKQTVLMGIVHEVSDDPLILSQRAQEFSRKLVEEMGPVI